MSEGGPEGQSVESGGCPQGLVLIFATGLCDSVCWLTLMGPVAGACGIPLGLS